MQHENSDPTIQEQVSCEQNDSSAKLVQPIDFNTLRVKTHSDSFTNSKGCDSFSTVATIGGRDSLASATNPFARQQTNDDFFNQNTDTTEADLCEKTPQDEDMKLENEQEDSVKLAQFGQQAQARVPGSYTSPKDNAC